MGTQDIWVSSIIETIAFIFFIIILIITMYFIFKPKYENDIKSIFFVGLFISCGYLFFVSSLFNINNYNDLINLSFSSPFFLFAFFIYLTKIKKKNLISDLNSEDKKEGNYKINSIFTRYNSFMFMLGTVLSIIGAIWVIIDNIFNENIGKTWICNLKPSYLAGLGIMIIFITINVMDLEKRNSNSESNHENNEEI